MAKALQRPLRHIPALGERSADKQEHVGDGWRACGREDGGREAYGAGGGATARPTLPDLIPKSSGIIHACAFPLPLPPRAFAPASISEQALRPPGKQTCVPCVMRTPLRGQRTAT